jgi:hypothetical protein
MTQYDGLGDYLSACGRGGRVATPWLSMGGQSGTTEAIISPRLRSSPASYHSIEPPHSPIIMGCYKKKKKHIKTVAQMIRSCENIAIANPVESHCTYISYTAGSDYITFGKKWIIVQ